ncbi:cell division ATP-binding protein FtsE [Candidatus Shapirobacteria bacterium CG08_land_8_20_14_0_20_39_18]|uniref:Cell division ATP-binding protein FtsE n=1 Tax=Candidatus Shapirobacteria bacterium CG08_land_8_20_14_0_20_39_18 TaxID=1974883 RepID=A0A2M6XDP7_9BACT|nr:MAG: cell division ATP-binding protein FtsE [Candidatus Shapirobacteria bacterium CG08_land_8_20_14_0_20_39_18]PIY66271.1 MAG: cell division ATP-binding protein FtsE [Candidatus Shapirobacteria bacterium CG_4_10_14_0_8_um_filter_39_15]
MIKFEKVTKKFGEITALEEVSFAVAPGDFVFLTGPSGAGKSTIIKLILHEYLPTSGTIQVDGINVEKMKSKEIMDLRRKVGVVFQDFKLLTDRTLLENVILPLEVFGNNSKTIGDKVKEVLELVGLSDRGSLFPAQLAGGELQRVCIARAMIGNPKILLADEPTGNLDMGTAWQIIKTLKKINKLGTTVLMATHNVEIVKSLKERVIALDKGKYEPS